ncbi:MAG: alpha/beta hydrolase [Deltaproteobacteria bacterium]|nr:alpha/beta hydrolase [Deltaproteobacteria bacterium]
MPYCEVMDTRIYYEVEGEGTTMLLVHGAAQDTMSWRFAVPFLSKKFRTVAVDLPGHGKSERSPRGVVKRTEDYAAYLNAIIDKLGLGKVVLMGHSMSGGGVLMTGLNRPDQVLAAVPLDGAGMTLRTAVSYSDDLMNLITINTYDYWETNFIALCGPKTSTERKRLIGLEALRSSAEVILGDLSAYTSFDIRDRIEEIEFPVVLITGGEDWSCKPENVAATEKRLKCPKAMEVLDGVGHFPHMEAPERVSEAAIRLLNKVAGI